MTKGELIQMDHRFKDWMEGEFDCELSCENPNFVAVYESGDSYEFSVCLFSMMGELKKNWKDSKEEDNTWNLIMIFDLAHKVPLKFKEVLRLDVEGWC